MSAFVVAGAVALVAGVAYLVRRADRQARRRASRKALDDITQADWRGVVEQERDEPDH